MERTRQQLRERRKKHIRIKVSGTQEKPRVYVFQSNRFLYAAVANDEAGKVLFSLRGEKKVSSLGKFGEEFGKKMKEAKIAKACFDRSGYKFHKRLTAFVDGLRKAGISI